MASPSQEHVQVKFFTKQAKFSIPDTAFSVQISVGQEELNSLINSLLNQHGDENKEIFEFDFLINSELLKQRLNEYIDQNDVSTETVINIEYLERFPAPEPEDSLQHDDWVSAVRASGDYVLTGSYDNLVRIWNTEGNLTTTVTGHQHPVKCVAWVNQQGDDTSSIFVSGSHDGSLLLWNWNRKTNSVEQLHNCRGHAGSVDAVAVDPLGKKFCSASWDKMLKLWSAIPNPDQAENGVPSKKSKTDKAKAPTRVPIITLSGHNEGVSSLQWLSDYEVCSASWDHTIRIWDMNQGLEKSLISGSKVFLSLSFSKLNGSLITSSSDRHIRLYDPRTSDGAIIKSTFTSHTAWVSCVAWSPNNENHFISGGYDNLVKLWDTRSPKVPLYDMTGHENKVLACDWSIPEYIMSGSADNHLKVFKNTDL